MKIMAASSPHIAKEFARSKEQQVLAAQMAARLETNIALATHEREKHELSVASNIATDLKKVQSVGASLDVRA